MITLVDTIGLIIFFLFLSCSSEMRELNNHLNAKKISFIKIGMMSDLSENFSLIRVCVCVSLVYEFL